MAVARRFSKNLDENVATGDKLFELELFHVAYDYYKYVIDHNETHPIKIIFCRLSMLYCQYNLAAVEITTLEAKVQRLVQDIIVEINKGHRQSALSQLLSCQKSLRGILHDLRVDEKRKEYIDKSAWLLIDKVNSEAFPEYASCMEMDPNNFEQKYNRLNAMLEYFKNQVGSDFAHKFYEVLADLCFDNAERAQSVDEKHSLLISAKDFQAKVIAELETLYGIANVKSHFRLFSSADVAQMKSESSEPPKKRARIDAQSVDTTEDRGGTLVSSPNTYMQ